MCRGRAATALHMSFGAFLKKQIIAVGSHLDFFLIICPRWERSNVVYSNGAAGEQRAHHPESIMSGPGGKHQLSGQHAIS